MTSEEKIALLEDFDAALSRWFNGSVGENEHALRKSLNEMAPVARSIVEDARTNKRVTISPPPAVGGVVLRDVDPFDMIFDSPYGISLIPTLRDAVQQAIGVVRSGRLKEEVKRAPNDAPPVVVPIPLSLPEKVTLKWLFQHVRYTFWLVAVTTLFAVFAFGVTAAQWSFIREILGR